MSTDQTRQDTNEWKTKAEEVTNLGIWKKCLNEIFLSRWLADWRGWLRMRHRLPHLWMFKLNRWVHVRGSLLPAQCQSQTDTPSSDGRMIFCYALTLSLPLPKPDWHPWNRKYMRINSNWDEWLNEKLDMGWNGWSVRCSEDAEGKIVMDRCHDKSIITLCFWEERSVCSFIWKWNENFKKNEEKHLHFEKHFEDIFSLLSLCLNTSWTAGWTVWDRCWIEWILQLLPLLVLVRVRLLRLRLELFTNWLTIRLLERLFTTKGNAAVTIFVSQVLVLSLRQLLQLLLFAVAATAANCQ